MKPRVIREKIIDEVKHDLSAAEENLRNLKFQLVTSQLEKTSQIRIAKREISRLKTVIREHELGIHLVGAIEKPAEK
jgi:large subunit ribosomal protein L29